MSDLVERLRAVGQDYDFHDNALVYEAADEIERLRAGGCACNQRTTQFCAEAADANTRATAAEARAVEAETALFQEVRRNDEMKRQLAAAREAMRRIIGTLDDPTGGQHVADMRAASAIARAALSNPPTPTAGG